jgi:hypothetical protein
MRLTRALCTDIIPLLLSTIAISCGVSGVCVYVCCGVHVREVNVLRDRVRILFSKSGTGTNPCDPIRPFVLTHYPQLTHAFHVPISICSYTHASERTNVSATARGQAREKEKECRVLHG